jgi:hypothetical protein
MTIDPCPRAICAEFNRKRSSRRRALRNPPSFNTRSSRRPKIWKDLDGNIVKTTSRYKNDMHHME